MVNSNYRVLVVDDEPGFRRWLNSLLNRSDEFKQVGEASSGSEAMSLIEHLMPDLVISDIYMPDIDGFELIRHIKQCFPNIHTVLISAYAERSTERMATQEGALAFIPKEALSLQALRQALKLGE